jgi:hypothetical protein
MNLEYPKADANTKLNTTPNQPLPLGIALPSTASRLIIPDYNFCRITAVTVAWRAGEGA